MIMDMRFRSLALAAATLSCVALTGCSFGTNAGSTSPIPSSLGTIRGKAFGGNQPVSGMHIYVYAAATSAYGAASQSLLTNVPGVTTVDGNSKYYVTTGSDGSFSITGDYVCTSGQNVYLYGVGGNTGAGVNSAAGMLAVLGTCPASQSLATLVPYVWMNEVTTVAAAYSLSGFATDATHVADDEGAVGNTTAALAQQGMANAFANSANLVSIAGGTALTSPPSATAGVLAPQAQINTIADVLAACVNSSSATSTNCTTLFANATSDGTPTGTQPSDTATAAINIAHNPPANVSTLWGLINGQAAFLPYTSAAAPTDFTVSIQYPTSSQGTVGMAADGNGNVFATYGGGNTVYKLTPAGVITTYVGTAATNPAGIALAPRHLAIDASNNVWVPTTTSSTTNTLTISEFDDNLGLSNQYNSSDGTAAVTSLNAIAIASNGDIWAVGTSAKAIRLNPSGVYQNEITGLPTGAFDIAINPNGVIGISSGSNASSTLSLFTSAGTSIATTTSAQGGLSKPQGVISDATGNFWLANGTSVVSEFTAAGAPVSSNGYTTTGTSFISGEFDGVGNYFTGGSTSVTGIYELNPSGTQLAVYKPLSIVTGGGAAYNEFFAADGSGNLWSAGNKVIYEMIGLSAPKVTPIVTATFSGKLATRP